MSKFNSLNPYRLNVNDRIIELNGPEIAELYRWHRLVRQIDSLMAEESQGVIDTLERGPIFERHETMLVTTKEIQHMQSWYKLTKPTGEVADKIAAALEAGLYGKRRPDLQALEDAEKAAQKDTTAVSSPTPEVKAEDKK
jgi:hypothetical protein